MSGAEPRIGAQRTPVQRASAWPCLSVNLPIRIMIRSMSTQMPKNPPSVTIWRNRGADLADVEAVHAEEAEEEAQQQRDEPRLLAGGGLDSGHRWGPSEWVVGVY